jgi:hypothetical protein
MTYEQLKSYAKTIGYDFDKPKDKDKLDKMIDDFLDLSSKKKRPTDTAKGHKSKINGMESAIDKITEPIKDNIDKINKEYYQKQVEASRQAKSTKDVAVALKGLDESYEKKIIDKSRSVLRRRSSQLLKVDTRRARGLSLTAADLRRIGVRAPGRLVSQFNLTRAEAVAVLRRK